MKPIAPLFLVAAAHVAFLYGGYGSKFFGIPLPYMLVMAIWLGASTVLAVVGYSKASARLPWLGSHAYRRHLFAIAAATASLYAGVFLAFNAFGT